MTLRRVPSACGAISRSTPGGGLSDSETASTTHKTPTPETYSVSRHSELAQGSGRSPSGWGCIPTCPKPNTPTLLCSGIPAPWLPSQSTETFQVSRRWSILWLPIDTVVSKHSVCTACQEIPTLLQTREDPWISHSGITCRSCSACQCLDFHSTGL